MDESLNRRIGLRRTDDHLSEPPPAAPDFAGRNSFASDPVLTACLDATLDEEGEDELSALGAYWGSAEAEEVARLAVATPPTLRRFDHAGRPIDQVELHPAFHALLNRSTASGIACAAWEDGDDRRQHRMRAAALFITAQCERGHLLPVCATHAAVAALAYAPDLEGELFPQIASRRYDRRALPASAKDGLLVSLAVGEEGTQLERGAVTMRGELQSDDVMRVYGAKPMVAAPMADMLLVLANTLEGPTAALVPRLLPENEGAVALTALWPLTGLAAAPFSRVAFTGAMGRLVGEPGRGVKVLRDVRTLTQLDAAVMSAGAMRAAVARAVHHARYHHTFGRPLLSHPLQARVLADIALEAAAHTALAMRLATAFDQAFESDGDHAVARVVTPAARILALKAGPHLAAEACEILGPYAALADHPAARLGADLTALTHWDGSANDAALELTALIGRDPMVLRDALDELSADLGDQNADLVEDVVQLGERAADDLSLSRALGEQLGMLAAASAMRRNLPRAVSDAYLATRLRERHRVSFGALDARFDADALIEFMVPED